MNPLKKFVNYRKKLKAESKKKHWQHIHEGRGVHPVYGTHQFIRHSRMNAHKNKVLGQKLGYSYGVQRNNALNKKSHNKYAPSPFNSNINIDNIADIFTNSSATEKIIWLIVAAIIVVFIVLGFIQDF